MCTYQGKIPVNLFCYDAVVDVYTATCEGHQLYIVHSPTIALFVKRGEV